MSTLSDMAETIRNTTGAVEMIAGGDHNNVEATAKEWIDAGFTPKTAREWWTVGAFDAARCAELVTAGLTPSECQKDRHDGMSLAYAHSNLDISTADVVAACRPQ